MTARERCETNALPIRMPTADEAEALARVAVYFDRAASEVGTWLLSRGARDGDAALLSALRESLLQGAGLCVNVLELAAVRASRQG